MVEKEIRAQVIEGECPGGGGPCLELELRSVGSLIVTALPSEGKIKVQYCPFNTLIMPFYLEKDQASALIQGLRILSEEVWSEE